MKKRILTLLFAAVGIISLALLAGCLKDKTTYTYTMMTPIYKTLTQIRGEVKSGTAQPLKQTGKLNVFGKYIFLNEVGKGIHVIDNSNPAAPKNVSFITIPGNSDIAVKGNFLYADLFSDLIALDISTPTNITAKKFVPNVFTDASSSNNNRNPDSVNIIVGYNQKDTTVDMATYQAYLNRMYYSNSSQYFSSSSPVPSAMQSSVGKSATVGTSGSLSRLTIINNYLYGVSNSDLFALDINNGADPKLGSRTNVGWSIETIYPFQNKLFIGSSSAMYIYDVSTPSNPAAVSQFSHFSSCDPVVADENYAYVTLRTGTRCHGAINQLQVINVQDLNQPNLVRAYSMTNPYGLSKDGNLVFICDGAAGLKIYDATNPADIKLMKSFNGMETYDVIAGNGNAIVVAKDGLYQFNYTNRNNIYQLSHITISR